jgi:hypothetical protein
MLCILKHQETDVFSIKIKQYIKQEKNQRNVGDKHRFCVFCEEAGFSSSFLCARV